MTQYLLWKWKKINQNPLVEADELMGDSKEGHGYHESSGDKALQSVENGKRKWKKSPMSEANHETKKPRKLRAT